MSEENIRLRIFESRSGDIEDLLSELNLGSCRVEKITREYGQPSSAVISMHRGTQVVIMLVTTAHSSWKHCALLAYIQLQSIGQFVACVTCMLRLVVRQLICR